MLHLPDVTLVCASTVYHDLTAMAVRECVRQVSFGDVKIWSDRALPGVESNPVFFRSVSDWDRFIWFSAWQHVNTSHFLVVQWDSWVLNPSQWTDAFLFCDYIGAPWGWHRDGLNVGNSGFSLWSKQLAKFVAEHDGEFPFACPMDVQLCRRHRPKLERYGFAWGDEALAGKFSFETVLEPPPQTFGFHGFRNWPFVLYDTALDERLSYCDEHAFKDGQLEWLIRNRDLCRSTRRNAA
jgi:Protein of unknown function (DUF5672)